MRHVDEIEGGVKYRIEKVGETKTEDKEVGHVSHPVIFWKGFKIIYQICKVRAAAAFSKNIFLIFSWPKYLRGFYFTNNLRWIPVGDWMDIICV